MGGPGPRAGDSQPVGGLRPGFPGIPPRPPCGRAAAPERIPPIPCILLDSRGSPKYMKSMEIQTHPTGSAIPGESDRRQTAGELPEWVPI